MASGVLDKQSLNNFAFFQVSVLLLSFSSPDAFVALAKITVFRGHFAHDVSDSAPAWRVTAQAPNWGKVDLGSAIGELKDSRSSLNTGAWGELDEL